eukprot:TRINITY_DN2347_c0_g1_i2.p1 TRINITY_DN2347_c0_g1~~TRINITY_DN2347_c0_g1_i2.p1  ORF type:complete len:455 (+),score=108.29 TRINITY_DN2347_c0_g1_i2:143-1507(+)
MEEAKKEREERENMHKRLLQESSRRMELEQQLRQTRQRLHQLSDSPRSPKRPRTEPFVASSISSSPEVPEALNPDSGDFETDNDNNNDNDNDDKSNEVTIDTEDVLLSPNELKNMEDWISRETASSRAIEPETQTRVTNRAETTQTQSSGSAINYIGLPIDLSSSPWFVATSVPGSVPRPNLATSRSVSTINQSSVRTSSPLGGGAGQISNSNSRHFSSHRRSETASLEREAQFHNRYINSVPLPQPNSQQPHHLPPSHPQPHPDLQARTLNYGFTRLPMPVPLPARVSSSSSSALPSGVQGMKTEILPPVLAPSSTSTSLMPHHNPDDLMQPDIANFMDSKIRPLLVCILPKILQVYNIEESNIQFWENLDVEDLKNYKLIREDEFAKIQEKLEVVEKGAGEQGRILDQKTIELKNLRTKIRELLTVISKKTPPSEDQKIDKLFASWVDRQQK